ncbi:MAG: hypothetical protein JST54_13815 [Deltaproteobacteria bacterium]|nr:hypothetical protein [Deltaproteobacteria bacterium]
MDDASELEPADVLAQATRLPRSLCAFVLRLTGYDQTASRTVLDRVLTEIPSWSRLPQGVLWKQVQTLVAHSPSAQAHPSEDVDLDVDVDLDDDASPPPIASAADALFDDEVIDPESPFEAARARAVTAAEAVIAAGRYELRSNEPLKDVPAACPACLSVRNTFPGESPRSCPTCGGPMILTFFAGEEADSSRAVYCEAFNARTIEEVRKNIDAGFDPALLGPVEEREGTLEHEQEEPTREIQRPKLPELELPGDLNLDLPTQQVARPSTPEDDFDAVLRSLGELDKPNEPPADDLFAMPLEIPGDPLPPIPGVEELPTSTSLPPPLLALDEVQPANELERAVLEADDWRQPLLGVPFELDALVAVRKRAALDAERELAAGVPRRVKAGEADWERSQGDCPTCLQSWIFPGGARIEGCPTCATTLVRHAALVGEVDEAALSYASAYNEAVLAGLRGQNPRFAWHLLSEAPGSIAGRLSAQSGVAVPLAGLAYDVSSGDESATLELLGWLRGRVTADGKSDAELLEAAQNALAEIGAEPDTNEVNGRHHAERLLQEGQLVMHVPDGEFQVCPSCLKRWPATDGLVGACPQCGGPMIAERPLGDDADETQRAVLAALNARMVKQIRAQLAPDFDPANVQNE